MKKVAILLALFCMLTVTASAAYIPEDVISENRDGRQLIVKTYMLPPDADPSGLVEEPFEVEGYSYHHLETVKEEQTFEDSKIQTEVVTLETDVDDLAAICAMRENWSPWETISYVWRSSGGRRQTPRCCARWTFCCLSP